MLVGAKVCDLTEDLLWFVCGLYVGILTSSLYVFVWLLTSLSTILLFFLSCTLHDIHVTPLHSRNWRWCFLITSLLLTSCETWTPRLSRFVFLSIKALEKTINAEMWLHSKLLCCNLYAYCQSPHSVNIRNIETILNLGAMFSTTLKVFGFPVS